MGQSQKREMLKDVKKSLLSHRTVHVTQVVYHGTDR